MRPQERTSRNRQDRIMEIVGFLLRRIIESPPDACCREHIIEGLEQQGYRRYEIDTAIELVLTLPEIISSIGPRPNTTPASASRVFSELEKQKLGLTVRGRLLQYRALGLLTEAEWEEVLMQLLLAEENEVGLSDLHSAIRRVVDDRERLMMILPANTARPIFACIN